MRSAHCSCLRTPLKCSRPVFQYCCSTVMNALDVALDAHLRMLRLSSRPILLIYLTVPPKLLAAMLYGCRTALALRSIAQGRGARPSITSKVRLSEYVRRPVINGSQCNPAGPRLLLCTTATDLESLICFQRNVYHLLNLRPACCSSGTSHAHRRVSRKQTRDDVNLPPTLSLSQ